MIACLFSSPSRKGVHPQWMTSGLSVFPSLLRWNQTVDQATSAIYSIRAEPKALTVFRRKVFCCVKKHVQSFLKNSAYENVACSFSLPSLVLSSNWLLLAVGVSREARDIIMHPNLIGYKMYWCHPAHCVIPDCMGWHMWLRSVLSNFVCPQ